MRSDTTGTEGVVEMLQGKMDLVTAATSAASRVFPRRLSAHQSLKKVNLYRNYF
jgi:hypothetical protein